MTHSRKHAWIVALLAFLASYPDAARAGDAPRRAYFSSFHVDQDLFAPDNQDRNYTMGVRIAWRDEAAARHLLNAYPWLDWIDDRLGMPHGEGTRRTFSLGNSAFTPDDLRQSAVIAEDRPYASLLYAESALVMPDSSGSSARGSKLVLGLLGLDISKSVQTAIHVANRKIAHTETPYDPKGWHNQISDQGEPTFLYQQSWIRRLHFASENLDGAWSCDGSIGYYSGASCGVAIKGGSIDKSGGDFWRLVDAVNPQGDAAQLARHDREIYWLAGLRLRGVVYNELLQGGFRETNHDFEPSDLRRMVAEGSLGFGVRQRNDVEWSWTCTLRSAEHRRAQRRAHQWCGFNLYRAFM